MDDVTVFSPQKLEKMKQKLIIAETLWLTNEGKCCFCEKWYKQSDVWRIHNLVRHTVEYLEMEENYVNDVNKAKNETKQIAEIDVPDADAAMLDVVGHAKPPAVQTENNISQNNVFVPPVKTTARTFSRWGPPLAKDPLPPNVGPFVKSPCPVTEKPVKEASCRFVLQQEKNNKNSLIMTSVEPVYYPMPPVPPTLNTMDPSAPSKSTNSCNPTALPAYLPTLPQLSIANREPLLKVPPMQPVRPYEPYNGPVMGYPRLPMPTGGPQFLGSNRYTVLRRESQKDP